MHPPASDGTRRRCRRRAGSGVACLLLLAALLRGPGISAAIAQTSPAPGSVSCQPQAYNTVCTAISTGTVTTAPRDEVRFSTPQAPSEPPAYPGGSARPGPISSSLQVRNASSQPGTVSFDGDFLTVVVPDGFAVQLQETAGPPLGDCAPAGRQRNAIRCPAAFPSGPAVLWQLDFTAADATTEPQTAGLSPPLQSVLLTAPAAEPGGTPSTLVVSASVDNLVELSWDGETLTVSDGGGETVRVTPSDGCQAGSAAVDAGTTVLPGFPGSKAACRPVEGGSVEIATEPPPSVQYPGQTVLAPHGFVRFTRQPPSPAPPPPAGQPVSIPAAGPGWVDVQSRSDQSLSLSYDGGTLGVAAPNGFTLQVLASSASSCRPAEGQANAITCGVSPFPGGANLVLSTAAADGSMQSGRLPPRAVLALSAATPGGASEAIVRSNTDQAATVTWDGSTLTVTVPDGFVAAPEYRGRAPVTPVPVAGCATDPIQQTLLTCSTDSGLATEVDFTTLTPPPSGTLALPYADSSGPGTLTLVETGPDASPSGLTVAVTLSQGDVELQGSGVIRPQPFGPGAVVDFSLSDARGGQYLYEGRIARSGGSWSGGGLLEAPGAPTSIDRWLLGNAQGPPPTGSVSIQIVGLGPAAVQTSEIPSLGLPLPELIAPGAVYDPAAGAGAPATPTVAGNAGQEIDFLAVRTFPWGLPDSSFSYQWFFGDGSESESTGEQRASHTYSSAGVYTVSAVLTDSTGVSSFGASEIEVDGP